MGARTELLHIITKIVASRDGTSEYAGECAERILKAILGHKLINQAHADEVHVAKHSLGPGSMID